MKKGLLTTLIVLGVVFQLSAQDYNTGIGVRGGFFNGLTVKHFIGKKAALEGILATRWRGVNLTGLYEIHHSLANIDGLNWYYGFGGHVGLWDGRYANWLNDRTRRSYAVIGADGIIGIEYNFPIPLNLSLDWKPAINIIGHENFWGDSVAFSVRYIF